MWQAVVLLLLFLSPSIVDAAPFERPLKLGDHGTDVRALQVFLNSDSFTRIAESGPGSPGQETDYFGEKTRMAVVKLQERNRATVLTPNGLTRGTGYVGPSTLALLSKTKGGEYTPTSEAKKTLSPKPVTHIPSNEEGLPGTLATIERLGRQQGFSDAEIARLTEAVTEQVRATTTPLARAFVEQVQRDNPRQEPIVLEDGLRDIARAFAPLFIGEPRLATDLSSVVSGFSNIGSSLGLGVGLGAPLGIGAASAMLPFGGAIVGVPVWCGCTVSWWIPITPLPPSFPAALMYFPGSQAFLSYNIPATLWLLGFYEPGPQCFVFVGVGCAPLPTQGLILPVVGSSPL